MPGGVSVAVLGNDNHQQYTDAVVLFTWTRVAPCTKAWNSTDALNDAQESDAIFQWRRWWVCSIHSTACTIWRCAKWEVYVRQRGRSVQRRGRLTLIRIGRLICFIGHGFHANKGPGLGDTCIAINEGRCPQQMLCWFHWCTLPYIYIHSNCSNTITHYRLQVRYNERTTHVGR